MVREYTDPGYRGSDVKRPAFQEMIGELINNAGFPTRTRFILNAGSRSRSTSLGMTT